MISIVVAHDDCNGIGKDNKLPWNCPDDLRFFKKLTTGHTVVMGYNTWVSLPVKPLPNRLNMIVSANHHVIEDETHPLDVLMIGSMELFKQYITNCKVEDMFIIGGAQIYKQALEMDIVDKMYITRIKGNYNCDTFFPMNLCQTIWDDWYVESFTDGCDLVTEQVWQRTVLAKKGRSNEKTE